MREALAVRIMLSEDVRTPADFELGMRWAFEQDEMPKEIRNYLVMSQSDVLRLGQCREAFETTVTHTFRAALPPAELDPHAVRIRTRDGQVITVPERSLRPPKGQWLKRSASEEVRRKLLAESIA